MNFAEAESYLYSLGNEVLAMKLGLNSERNLLSALDNPHRNYFKVQIAGTNGKGSVCAFLDAICRAARIKTGLTTSPHLISITERVKINGEQISEHDFARLATPVREATEKLVRSGELESVPTYFEQVTAIALLAFSEAGVELAILETGLGGRLDATTAAGSQIVGITRIDLDHQFILGDSLSQIAAEKAAIINSTNQTVVIGEQFPEAMRVILDRCSEFGIAPLLATDVRVEINEGGLLFRTNKAGYQVKRLGVRGEHQIENAKAAVLLAESLQDRFDIDPNDIINGLENACHAGRLDLRGEFLLDGAHNIGGALALRKFLDEEIRRPITIIFGTMRDKDAAEIIRILFPNTKHIILTRPDNPRSASPSDLARSAMEFSDRIIITESVSGAISTARRLREPDGLIVITGSLYLVGEAMKILNN